MIHIWKWNIWGNTTVLDLFLAFSVFPDTLYYKIHLGRYSGSMAYNWNCFHWLFKSNLTSLLTSVLKNLRQQILELLGPISMNHGTHFMAAIAYVWNERKQVKTPVRNKVGFLKKKIFKSIFLILFRLYGINAYIENHFHQNLFTFWSVK